jgi:sulfite exporter TauE/SafE
VPDVAFFAAILAGLTGSLHCIAMCGGFATATVAPVAPLLPARVLARQRVAIQAGRLATYALLGAALGSLGGAAFAIDWTAWQRGLHVAANVALGAAAASVAGVGLGGPTLERAGLAIFRRAAPRLAIRTRGGGLAARFALGMLWGLTPCALIYALLPVALLAGGPLEGGIVMAGLWLGTLPALLAASGAARLALRRPGSLLTRRIAGLAIGSFALLGLARALLEPGLPLAGPFCFVR